MRKLIVFALALPLCIGMARAGEHRGGHDSTVTMNNDSASDDCRDHLRVGDDDYRSSVRDEEVKTVPNQPLTITAEHSFVPARSVPAVENVPNNQDFAPRFSVVYDLLGNSKSALKYSINRYNRAVGTLLANSFNTLSATTRVLPWTDLNGNDIAEVPSVYDAAGNPTYCVYLAAGCEINLSTLRAANGTFFGLPGDAATYEPYERTWNLEQRIELEHQLTSRIAVTASWTHGSDHDLTKTINRYRRDGDYGPVTIYNPIDGTPITVYSLKRRSDDSRYAGGSQGGANLTYTSRSAAASSTNSRLDFRARLYRGAQIFGGWTASRNRDTDCSTSRSALVIDPNTLRFCDEFNLPTGLDIKLAHDFRVSGSLPLKWQGFFSGSAT